ncbi:hypothetical protein SESBI_35254 [Sesbania bispinosa]|nr:hypothetical protein SESBI_35254 [Sesbania bispinosa]
MGCNKLIRLDFQKFSRRKFHGTAEKSSKDWRGLIERKLQSVNPVESDSVCIYRVPPHMRNLEPKAFIPSYISIGPYHYGAPHLQNMEILKTKFFARLFDPNGVNGAKLEEAFKFLEEQEANARRCYMGDIKLSSDEFLQMMLVDGSFIVQLLRDLSQNEFKQVPSLSRWMLPIFRKELIMLENQLPLFVLSKLFEITTDHNSTHAPSQTLNDLAFRFFYHLLQSDSIGKIPECQTIDKFRIEHVLDLLRADENRELLDISFGKKWGMLRRELTIPRLHISDHRGTVFRNIVAFEKCHKRCNPDLTTYIFFFNRLINSVDDVADLHYKGVIHHSLGSDQQVADLINSIAKEIVPDMNESYLYKVVNDANQYFDTKYARVRASIVHNYLTSWAVGVTTFLSMMALYFTFIQTLLTLAGSHKIGREKQFSSMTTEALVPFLDLLPFIT